uniref:J domain-containing protein n=1 Tax=Meloidogyne enterolobii TaxID=390850 RepID=A0A6V7VGH3_MELEN|nr:unnamed protein product [Meloidogyne enterolobii]
MAFIYLVLLFLSLFNFIFKIESTHYKTLMVDKNASPDEIEEAFNERKEKNRTAKQSDKDFFDNLGKLSEAHSILSDKTKREEYDRELAKNKGKSKEGESSKAGNINQEDHFRGGTIHNTGNTFFGKGDAEFVSGDQINIGFPFGGSRPSIGKGFPRGGNIRSWNGGVDFVKLSVFKEGILVESPEQYSEFVKNLKISGGVGKAIIYGNNIKAKTKGSNFLEEPVKVRVNGGIGNVSTTTSRYVFEEIKPNHTIKDSFSINGGIQNLEVHISDENGNNNIKINGGISNVQMIGEGNTYGNQGGGNAGYQRASSFGGGSHHSRGRTYNTGSFFGDGFGRFDSGSQSGSGFQSAQHSQSWNGGLGSVKVSVFDEGILVESSQHYSEFVKNLKINGGVGNAIINGNNIKFTEYWSKTDIFINGVNVRYNEGVTTVDGVRIEKNGEKIKITGRNITPNTNLKGYKMMKGMAFEFRAKGGVGNITTSTDRYVFNQIKPQGQAGNALSINGGITTLEVVKRTIFFKLFHSKNLTFVGLSLLSFQITKKTKFYSRGWGRIINSSRRSD